MREVAFPMVDAYRPVRRARIPVPGLNRFPPRANVLGRHYFGLDNDEVTAVPGKAVAFNSEQIKVVNAGNDDEVAGFAGFADCAEVQTNALGSLGLVLPPGWGGGGSGDETEGGGSGGGIDWGSIINAGIHAAPAIIQAAEGGGAPWNYYQQAVSQPQQSAVPQGYYRDTSGQLIPLGSAQQVAGGVGVGVAQIGNSLSSFVTQNPMLVLGAGVLVLFLFMKPPGRR